MAKMSRLQEFCFTLNECTGLVSQFFKGDEFKTEAWFETPNPLLGGVSPVDMIWMGKVDQLLRLIKTQLKENEV